MSTRQQGSGLFMRGWQQGYAVRKAEERKAESRGFALGFIYGGIICSVLAILVRGFM